MNKNLCLSSLVIMCLQLPLFCAIANDMDTVYRIVTITNLRPGLEMHSGLCRTDGEILVEPRFGILKKCERLSGWWATEDEKIPYSAQLLDPHGVPLTKTIFAPFNDPYLRLFPIETPSGYIMSKGLVGTSPFWTLVDTFGKCVPLAPAEKISEESLFRLLPTRQFCAIMTDGGKFALWDISKGANALEQTFDLVDVSDSCMIVAEDGMMGLTRFNGTEILPLKFDDIREVGKSVFKVSSGDTVGLFSLDIGWILPLQHCDDIVDVTGQAAIIRKGGASMLVSLPSNRLLVETCGEIILRYRSPIKGPDIWMVREPMTPLPDTTYYGLFADDLLSLGKWEYLDAVTARTDSNNLLFCLVGDSNGRHGAIAMDGRKFIVKPSVGQELFIWGDKIGIHQPDSRGQRRFSIVDHTGKCLLRFGRGASCLCPLDASGHAKIVCGGKAGLVDGECRFALPCEYEDVGAFAEGMVAAMRKGKWGFVDLHGKWHVPARFEAVKAFRSGYAPAMDNGKWGFVDKFGMDATPFLYDDVKDIRDGHFRAKIGGKWGIFALDGSCALPAEFDEIYSGDEAGYSD